MTDRDDFLTWVGTRLKDAEVALHNGDPGPRFAIWSTNEPVSVLGAWYNGVGVEEVHQLFRRLEDAFSGCTSFRYDVVAADVVGDVAYTVGFEHTEAAVNGEPSRYSLRVTQVYRREDGEWKVAHRHADPVEAEDASA